MTKSKYTQKAKNIRDRDKIRTCAAEANASQRFECIPLTTQALCQLIMRCCICCVSSRQYLVLYSYRAKRSPKVDQDVFLHSCPSRELSSQASRHSIMRAYYNIGAKSCIRTLTLLHRSRSPRPTYACQQFPSIKEIVHLVLPFAKQITSGHCAYHGLTDALVILRPYRAHPEAVYVSPKPKLPNQGFLCRPAESKSAN